MALREPNEPIGEGELERRHVRSGDSWAWLYADPSSQAAAVVAAMHGASLPDLDSFLEALAEEDSPAARELLDRRREALACLLRTDRSGFLRHLEWMVARRRHIEREAALLPLAKAGESFRKGRKPGAEGPLRRHIAAILKSRPRAMPSAVWEALAKRPPSGWEFHGSSSADRYAWGPNSRHVSYKWFSALVKEERERATKIRG